MNFQELINQFPLPCCIMRVKKSDSGLFDDIRIVCSNEPYREVMGPKYYDNMPYYELVPQDPKFEDICYRAAILRQRMHAYVETRALGAWTDQVLIPVGPTSEDEGYCQFFFEFTKSADPSRMASASMRVAQEIITENLALLKNDNFKEGIYQLLKDITEITQSSTSRIMLIDNNRDEAINFCEYYADEDFKRAFELKGRDGVISYETVKSWEFMLGVSNEIITKEKEDFERLRQFNNLWVEEILDYNVYNIILVPLKQHQEIFGYLYIINYNIDNYVETKEFVELLSVFLATQVYNYLLMEKLEKLSTTDALTGLNNRTMMMDKVRELVTSKKKFGAINLDLNGLKRVNDTAGHDAGDKFIFNASNVLLKAIDHKYVYRPGGDEFVIIIDDITEEGFNEHIENLKKVLVDNPFKITFAYGSCWCEECDSVHEVFITADKRMYVNKEEFYRKYPELKRIS